MRAGWLALAGAMVLAQGASAQQSLIDPATVTACFEGAAQGSIDPDCIGAAGNACQTATPDGSTTQGISQCYLAENDAWDVLLNREYALTRDSFGYGPEGAATLLEAQRAWIKLRDADCRFAYDRYGNGSMRNIAGSACKMQHTARRALLLRSMRDN